MSKTEILQQSEEGGLFFGSWNNAEVIKVANVELFFPRVNKRISFRTLPNNVQHSQYELLKAIQL